MDTWNIGDLVEHVHGDNKLLVEVTELSSGTRFSGIVISDTRKGSNQKAPGYKHDFWHGPAFKLKTSAVTADTVIEQLEQLERKYHD